MTAADPMPTTRARLHELYQAVGSPSHEVLKTRASLTARQLPTSTSHDLLESKRLSRWATIEAFVVACREHGKSIKFDLPADLFDLGEWKRLYDQEARPSSHATSMKADNAPPLLFNVHRVVDHFSGREKLLSDLSDRLVPGPVAEVRILAVLGLGGIGKTQLAAEFCRRASEHFGIIAWLPAHDTVTLREQFVALGRRLGVVGGEGDDLVALTSERLASEARPWLLVLDNVEQDTDFVNVYPRHGNGSVLITSRFQGLKEFPSLPVKALELNECVEYLLKATSRDELDGARRLASAVGGLPLALSHAVAYVREMSMPFDEYLETLENLPARDLLNTKPSAFYQGAIASTWQRSFQAAAAVSNLAPRMLERLSFLSPVGVPHEMSHGPSAAEALQTDKWQLQNALRALSQFSLVEMTERTVEIHRMVQKVTREDVAHRREQKEVLTSLGRIMTVALSAEGVQHDWNWSVEIRPHLFLLLHWFRAQSMRDLQNDVVVAALWQCARAAATSPIEVVNKTTGLVSGLRDIRRHAPAAELGGGDLGVLLTACLGDPDESAVPAACKRLAKGRASDHDVACALYLVLHIRGAEAQTLILSRNDRVRAVLTAHSAWTACVRFACAQAAPDQAAVAALEAGTVVGDPMAVGRWLTTLTDLFPRQAESRLRRYASNHEQITLALAKNLENQRRFDERLDVLRAGIALGPQVPMRLASVLLEGGRRADAQEVLRRAVHVPQAAIRLASLLQEDGDDAGAEAVLRPWAGKEANATLELARLLLRTDRHDDAEEVLVRPARVWPEAALLAHGFQVGRGDLVGAATTLKPHLGNDRVRSAANKIVARVHNSDSAYTTVMSELSGVPQSERARKRANKKFKVVRPAPGPVIAQAHEYMTEAAYEDVVQTLVPAAEWSSPAERSHAVVNAAKQFAATGDRASAAALLAHFSGTLPAAALELAWMKLRDGDHEAALELAVAHLDQARTDPDIAIQISRVQQKVGPPADALATLEMVAEPDLNVLMRTADLLALTGQPDLALRILLPHLDNPHPIGRFRKICDAHDLYEAGLTLLAELPKSDAVRDLASRLDRKRHDGLERAVNLAWFYGNRKRAVELLSGMDSPEPRILARLLECLTINGETDRVFDLLTRTLPTQRAMTMQAVELCSEIADLATAERLLGGLVHGTTDAAIGLSGIAFKVDDKLRAEGFLAAHADQTLVRSIANLLAMDLTDPVTAVKLAHELIAMGHLGFAESVLEPVSHERSARVELADLLRTRLAFDECRALLADLAETFLPAACSTATAWLRNGNPNEAERTLRNYRGTPTKVTYLARFMLSVRERPGDAVMVAKNFLNWGQKRCAYEVLQVTDKQTDSRVRDLYQLHDMYPTNEHRSAIGRVRLRALYRDYNLALTVWPDFRSDLRPESNRQRLASVIRATIQPSAGPEAGEEDIHPPPAEVD
ncbi:NB-ARC domain-containing protein [Lentzea sp. NPDC006480]|uniref:tetratricopeptide repeat protein n=1 Tax=Lentzea sp. NPDC006480 TaxID=3157176 RepID=UPI00339FBA20